MVAFRFAVAPIVSVVLAVRRPDPRYFRSAVQSILEQTLRDFECIVVEDDTETATGDDSRLRRVRGDNRGLAAALNKGIEAARAPLIARMDADDLALPTRLEQQVRFLSEHPDVTVVGSRITVIDGDGKRIGSRRLPLTHDDIAKALRRYNCISHPSVMFRRDAILIAGGYDTTTRAEDYDLWCRLVVRGNRLANVNHELTLYRFHPAASKWQGVHDEIRATIRIKEKHFADRFTMRDRMRILAERVLLLLPSRVIVWLFAKLQYD